MYQILVHVFRLAALCALPADGMVRGANTPPASRLQKIDIKKYPLARCLDGSPGAFFFEPAVDRNLSNKWSIFYPAGGMCSVELPRSTSCMDTCESRKSTGAGSSMWYKDMAPWRVPLELDGWNQVMIAYCDGGAFSGMRIPPYKTKSGDHLYLRGGYIVEAVRDTLLKEHGLRSATDVVVTGSSVGAIAVYLHLDGWREALPSKALVVGFADEGFGLDPFTQNSLQINASAHPWGIYNQRRRMFHILNASSAVNQRCLSGVSKRHKDERRDPSDCFVPFHSARFVQSPVFARQSTMDSHALSCVLDGLDEAKKPKLLQTKIVSALQLRFFRHNPQHGGFIDSCPRHLGWWNISINDVKVGNAFHRWYDAIRSSNALDPIEESTRWFSIQRAPCEDCCMHTKGIAISYRHTSSLRRDGRNGYTREFERIIGSSPRPLLVEKPNITRIT